MTYADGMTILSLIVLVSLAVLYLINGPRP